MIYDLFMTTKSLRPGKTKPPKHYL